MIVGNKPRAKNPRNENGKMPRKKVGAFDEKIVRKKAPKFPNDI